MDGYGATFFDTPLGLCGLAWTPRGVKALQLPEETPEATRARLMRKSGAPFERRPPDEISEIVMRIGKLLAGYRDRKPADRGAIVAALNAMSQMIVDFPCIVGMDINPLLAEGQIRGAFVFLMLPGLLLGLRRR